MICVFIDLVQENQILIQAAGGSAPSNLAYLLLQVFILPGPVLDIPGPALRGKDLCRGKNQRPDALRGSEPFSTSSTSFMQLWDFK